MLNFRCSHGVVGFRDCLKIALDLTSLNMYEITENDLSRGRKLKIGAVAAPFVLTLIPALITFVLMLLAASGPPAAAVILFFGLIATTIGFVSGVVIPMPTLSVVVVLVPDVDHCALIILLDEMIKINARTITLVKISLNIIVWF